MTRRWAKSTALAILIAAPVQAQPADDAVSQVEALAGEARALYDAGEFGQAVAKYLEAYKLQPTAAVLYNVAVIYDKKLKEVDLAIDFYRRYIGSPDADPQAVQRATARLQALKAEKETRRQAELSTLTPTGGGQAEGQRTPPPAPMSTQAVTGWVMASAGAALLIGGGVVGYLAGDSQEKFADSTREVDDRIEARDVGEDRALIADVLLGAGAAATITGLLLVVLDDGPAEAEGTAIHVGPRGDGFGVSVGGVW